MAWFAVGSVSEIPVEEMNVYEVDGISVTVYHLEDGWYATSDICTHQDCSLAEGELENNEVICWCHGGAFDVRTGKATKYPCVIPLETFPVRIQDGQIEIDV